MVTNGIAVNGCGYASNVDGLTTDYIAGSCGSSALPNNLMFGNVDATYTGNQNAIFGARNSVVTIGDGSFSMPANYDKMARAGT